MSVPVVVELVGLAACDDDEVRWRVAVQPLGDDLPDDVARRLSGPGLGPLAVLHSTSWRHTGQELVLTYALFPDPRAALGGRALRHHLVTGPGPRQPSPPEVLGEHVAAHAVRHLAYLAQGRDPHVLACARALPADWSVLVRHGRAVHVHDPALRGLPVAAG